MKTWEEIKAERTKSSATKARKSWAEIKKERGYVEPQSSKKEEQAAGATPALPAEKLQQPATTPLDSQQPATTPVKSGVGKFLLEKGASGAAESSEGFLNAMSRIGQMLGNQQRQQAIESQSTAALLLGNKEQSAELLQQAADAGKIAYGRDQQLVEPFEFGDRYAARVEEKYADANLSKGQRLLGDVAQGVGGLVPSIAANVVAPGSGMAVMTAGAFGNAVQEAKKAGADDATANAYGAAVAAVEAATEKIWGGMGGLFGTGAIDDVVKSAIANNIKSGAARAALTTVVSMLSEGAEEFLAEYGQLIANKLTIKTDDRQVWSRETLGDAGKSALIGAIIGGLMNIGESIEAGKTPRQAVETAAEEAAKKIKKEMPAKNAKATAEQETEAVKIAAGGKETIADNDTDETALKAAEEKLKKAVEANRAKAAEREKEIPKIELKGIEEEQTTNTKSEEKIPRIELPGIEETAKVPAKAGNESQRDIARRIGDYIEESESKKTSPAELGIENGGSIPSVAVLDSAAAEQFDLSEAAEIAQEAGYEPVFVSGLFHTAEGGLERWGKAGNKLYIQADSANYTAADIAREAIANKSVTAAAPTEQKSSFAKMPRKSISIYKGGIDSEDQYTKEYIASGRISESDLQTISDTAKALGLKVRFANSLVGGKVGAQIENGIVTISASSSKPLRRLFGHEITHRLQELAPAAYNQMRSIIQNSESARAQVREVMENYKSKDLTISELDALDEVVAEYAGSLLEDEGALEQLISKGDKTLLEKLREVFRALADKLTGRQKTQAERVYEKLTEAMEDAGRRVSNYQTNGGKKASPDINPGFAEARFSVEPPYRKGTKEGERFLNELDSKASKTYQLFDNIHTIGEENMVEITVGAGKSAHPKKVNITMQYMLASKWNDYCDSNPEFAETAEMLAGLLPDAVKKNANIRDDGRIEETPFEDEFKMERAFIQRIVDALPMEVINSTVVSDGRDIKVSNKNKVLSIGGEAYRRSLVEERRAMYRKGKLPTKTIATLSKDNWGAMGFLATNGKTGASGDFTTLCPQMYFNRGCFYCYRRAALTSGVNNKLTGETVWYTGEILQLTQSDVEMLNQNGGLRIQSFGDWMEQYSAQLADLLMDAEEVGLQIKIITKEPSMIETVALLKEQGIGNNLYFNLSADYVIEEQGKIDNRDSNGALPRNPDRPFMKRDGKTYWKRALTVEEAAEYRSKYDWVNTRIVATTLDEFIEGLRSPYVDVVTGYHGSLRAYERVSSATGETLVDVEPLGDAGMPRFVFIRGKWQLEYEGKTKTHKKLAQAIEDAGLQWEYYIKSCCITGRCATCKGKCGKLANIFGVKNATNRDAESLAYWQEQMDSAADNPLLVSQMEETSGVKYSIEDEMKADEGALEMEQRIIRLRNERDEINDSLLYDDLSEIEVKKLENRLVKVNAELDKLITEESKATVLTPVQTILDNLDRYRITDLYSLAEQISQSSWDDYEELSRNELEEALREMIQNQELSPMEMQAPKYGYYVRKPAFSEKYSIEERDEELEGILSDLQAATEKNAVKAETATEGKKTKEIISVKPVATADEAIERKLLNAETEAAEEEAPENLAAKMSNSRGDFTASPAVEKLGVKVVNSIGKYNNVKQLISNVKASHSLAAARKKAETRLKVTAKEKLFARGIANGTYSESDIPEGWDKRTVLEMSEWYMAERNFGESYIDKLKQALAVDLDAATAQMFEGIDESKVSPAIVLNHRTVQRNMLKIFGAEKGAEINRWLFDPVNQNEAERIRFINRQYDKVRTFEDQSGKQRALNKEEREMVQRVMEGRVVLDTIAELENKQDIYDATDNLLAGEDIGDLGLEFGLTLEEQEIVESYANWLKVQDRLAAMDNTIINNAVEKYTALFDDYYDAINDFLAAHGYQPIGFIKGYVPHLQPEKNQTALQSAFEKLGFNADVSTLPASIAGLTGEFKPNKKWNPYFLHRNGTVTQFDIAEAFESYVSHMADMLYHMDDIMRIRNAVKYFRRTYSPEEIRNSIEWAEKLRTMPKSERVAFLYDEGIISASTGEISNADSKELLNKYIDDMYGKIENTSKFNNLVVYLENYANILAGKQSIADRGEEASLGRKILNVGNKITRIFSRANVAGNISSALNQSSQLPMILAENGIKNTTAAFKDIVTGNLRKQGWAEDSDYLTTKKGVDFIVSTPGEMFVDVIFKPMELVDGMLSTLAVRSSYLDAIKRGMSHEEAMQYADRKAVNIMGDRSKGAKPLAFESKKPISSMLHMFQVEALNSWDHLISDLPGDFRQIEATEGRNKAAAALASVIAKTLISTFALNRLAEKLYGGTPAPFDIFGLTANFIASGQSLGTNSYLEALIDKVMMELFGTKLFDTDDDELELLADEEFNTAAAFEDLGYNLSNEIPFLSNLSALLGLGDKTLPLPDLTAPAKTITSGIKNKNVLEALDGAVEALGEIVPAGRQAVKTYTGAKTIIQGGKMKGYGEKARLQYPVRRTAGNITQALLFGTSGLQENQDYYASGRGTLTAKETMLWKTLVANGADEEEAYKVIYSTKGEDVKGYEKLQIMAAPTEWDNDLKYEAMMSVVSDSAGYKIRVLQNYEISADLYAEATAAMYDAAAERIAELPEDERPERVNITQEDAKKVLKAMSGISNQEKAMIWQMTNAGWAVGKNPFSSTVGKKAKAEYEAIKERAEKKKEAEDEEEIPRITLRGLE